MLPCHPKLATTACNELDYVRGTTSRGTVQNGQAALCSRNQGACNYG